MIVEEIDSDSTFSRNKYFKNATGLSQNKSTSVTFLKSVSNL